MVPFLLHATALQGLENGEPDASPLRIFFLMRPRTFSGPSLVLVVKSCILGQYLEGCTEQRLFLCMCPDVFVTCTT